MPAKIRTRYRPQDIDRDAAELALSNTRARNIDLDSPTARDVIADLGAGAPAVLPALWRQPELVATLSRELSTHGEIAPAVIARPRKRARTNTIDKDTELDEAKKNLRRLRDAALVRTALRELHETVDVDTTAAEWSRVASGCVSHAIFTAQAVATARNGPPLDTAQNPVAATVFGMGKLGGEELNLGSDIDLCVFYATDDGAAGERSLLEHFARVSTLSADLLGDVTADGFAFRVDLRLRPEGSRGPAATSVPVAQRYYNSHGRPWERAAMLRARPIAGDLSLGRALLSSLSSFIWPAEPTPGIALDLGAMLTRARRELMRDDSTDLKLGRGGIREAEFFVQALQLLHGQRYASLRVPSTLRALSRLTTLGLVTHRDARELDTAWGLLRRVEHRLQVMAPFATHELPAAPLRLHTLARSLGYPFSDELLSDLTAARDRVHSLFTALHSPSAAQTPATTSVASAETTLALSVSSHADIETLTLLARTTLGVRDPEGAALNLQRLARRNDQPLSPVALGSNSSTLTAITALFREVRDAPDPDMALGHLAELFEKIRPADRHALWLVESPVRARALVGLFGSSEFLSRTFLAQPERSETAETPPAAPAVEELPTWLSAAVTIARTEDPEDLDNALGALRSAARLATLEIGLADVANELDPTEVTERLTLVAEESLRQCLSLAAEECASRWGTPGPNGPLDGIAVIAMGSLAARELGYGGDLDLLFLFDTERSTSGGVRGVTTLGEYSVRLAQRTLWLLSTPHAQGPGWATDTRLRPAGSQGTLVTSREAFARYHASHAASWERQALLRARPVAGDATLCAALDESLAHIAYERGPADLVELRRLRARMELELGREDRGVIPLKYGRGALVDVEFAAQALQMAHGRDPSVRTPNTRLALNRLRDNGYLRAAEANVLLQGELSLRRVLLATRLTTLRGELVPSAPSALTVARRLGYRERAGNGALDGLLADLAATRDTVRRAWRAVLDQLEQTTTITPR